MNRVESERFLKVLGLLALGWLGLGCLLTGHSTESLTAFLEIYIYSTLDLIFLILVFWILFFGDPAQRSRKVQILVFFTFKLVCLGFLAITLKRLRNASLTAILMGIGFVFAGPLIASVIKIKLKGNERDTRI